MNKHFLASLALFVFSISLSRAQCPPAGFPAIGETCATAPLFCGNLDGYCNSLGTNNVQQPFPGCPTSVLNNDDWFRFIAGDTLIEIEIIPFNCQGTGGLVGMQGAIYASCPATTPLDLQCPCTTNPFLLSYDQFVVGQEYYFVVDGCAGDICEYEINILQGSTLPMTLGPISGETTVCPGSVTTYSVPAAPAVTYTWSISPASAGTLIGVNPNFTIDVLWDLPGEAELCVSAADTTACADQIICLTIDSELLPATDLGQIVDCAPSGISVCGENYTQSGSYSAVCQNWQGCDSTVNFELALLNPLAIIDPAIQMLGCGVSTVLLDGSGSLVNPFQNGTTAYFWAGPGIAGPNNGTTVTVAEPGQYCLTVTHGLNGVTCEDTACILVEEDNAEPTITWLGQIDWWDDPQNWDLGYVPEPCNHVDVPLGFSTVPVSFHAVGKTLFVHLGARLEVPVGATMTIE